MAAIYGGGECRSCSHKGAKNSQSGKDHSKQNNGMFGKIHSKETKLKIGNKSKSRWSSLEYKYKMFNIFKSDEFKKNMSNVLKNKWSSDIYFRDRVFKGLNLSINKKETILLEILDEFFPSKFVFVGNGKFWVDRYNPDFIDEKNKLIIEMYGDYWHNLLFQINKDKDRLKMYSKYGYETLIVWEKELKNKDNLIHKLKGFIK